ncbi:chemotaxis-specific protein-glutamate methyltransferase CheB [Salinarimonas ramus]|uniref:Protein-glutamate methylesterase/protein-glutamine glutaminase n=1 Tax=Salinarimonas ramus TaxID=690164 RepID=A0A917V6K3_9HYPH|nr:chemotaxis-specific protein-glutamate methyltransferase CheB [Salinarimonas ramus]GGK44777.1 chemotaxis response regulator protein-glutamate methylesterase of group 2 operon [Salinarimonas ramus]
MSSALASTSHNAPPQAARVMIVDDSVVVRGLTSRWLEEAGFVVAATCSNGKVAVDQVERARPDIIVLDIEMPEMDGLEALPLLLAKAPKATIIVISTLTQRNAQVSLKCLSMGATDYLPKPESHRGVTTSTTFRAELIAKVQGLAARHRRGPAAPAPGPTLRSAPAAAPSAPTYARAPVVGQIRPAPEAAQARMQTTRVVVRPRMGLVHPKALLVGASTGGPRAVGEMLAALAPSLKSVPVLIVQHMPPIFTAVFAEHLGAQTKMPAAEGRDGEKLEPGRIYVAPGGKHMGLRKDATGAVHVRIDDGPPENFCKPAVDVLFRDAAAVYGSSALSVVLTGMGSDGTIGAKALVGAGGLVYAQDEATSTVWGMPGSIAKAGLAHEILPLPALAPALKSIITGGAA